LNKYVLLQAPKAEGEISAQIIMIDNSTDIGKGRVESRIQDGYTHIGWIESDLRIPALKRGFEHYWHQQVNEAYNLFRRIADITDDYLRG